MLNNFPTFSFQSFFQSKITKTAARFMVQQGQLGSYAMFATPWEYRISPEVGDCIYDEQSLEDVQSGKASFQAGLMYRTAAGQAETT